MATNVDYSTTTDDDNNNYSMTTDDDNNNYSTTTDDDNNNYSTTTDDGNNKDWDNDGYCGGNYTYGYADDDDDGNDGGYGAVVAVITSIRILTFCTKIELCLIVLQQILFEHC